MRYRIYTRSGSTRHCNEFSKDTLNRADKVLDTKTGIWIKHREYREGSKARR